MTRTRIIALALASTLFLMAGCAAPSESQQAQEAPSQPTNPVVQVEPQQSKSATLGFIGDICLADNYIPMQSLAEKGSTNITDGIDARFVDAMQGVDIMWVNNEFAYGTDAEPLEGKMWTFLAAPENVHYLNDLGVDIAGLANNHAFDYGEGPFLQTLDTLAGAGIPYVGAGRNSAEAQAPVIMKANGIKVAYVAASCAELTIYTPEAGEDSPGIMWCYDDAKFLDAIAQAAASADFVVALPHWGTEHSTVLEEKQIESSRAYIDAGADIVVGAHAHILQGMDFYQGKPILYNLGNFWFDDYDIDTVMAVLDVSMEGEAEPSVQVRLLPGTQSGVFTAWSDESERNRIFRYLEEISGYAVTISDDGVVNPA